MSFVPPSATAERSGSSRGASSSSYSDLKAVANLSVEEKKVIIKQIIEKIPTNIEELFTYPIDWKAVDSVTILRCRAILISSSRESRINYLLCIHHFQELVDVKIKPWVDKKIKEYLGEPEQTLSKFICEQLLEHKPPSNMLRDIGMVRIFI